MSVLNVRSMWRCFRLLKRLKIPNVAVYYAAIVTASVLFMAGCGVGYRVEPDRTTYPRELIRQKQVKMSLLPGAVAGAASVDAGGTYSHQSVTEGRPFLEFQQTTIGDSATHETRIIPNERGAWNEAALLASAPEAGRRICGKHYRIISTEYYNGTEATSGFLGISHPWLKVKVRCALDLNIKGDHRKELIASVSKEVPDADYFDIHEKNYTFGVAKLRAVVEKVLAARRISITKSFRANDMDVIVTGRYGSGLLGLLGEQLIAVLANSDNGSVLTVRLLVYERDAESRLILASRNFAYQRLGNFLGEITKTLEAGM